MNSLTALQQLSTLTIVQPYNTALVLHNASINSLKVVSSVYRTLHTQPEVMQTPDAAWFAHYE